VAAKISKGLHPSAQIRGKLPFSTWPNTIESAVSTEAPHVSCVEAADLREVLIADVPLSSEDQTLRGGPRFNPDPEAICLSLRGTKILSLAINDFAAWNTEGNPVHDSSHIIERRPSKLLGNFRFHSSTSLIQTITLKAEVFNTAEGNCARD